MALHDDKKHTKKVTRGGRNLTVGVNDSAPTPAVSTEGTGRVSDKKTAPSGFEWDDKGNLRKVKKADKTPDPVATVVRKAQEAKKTGSVNQGLGALISSQQKKKKDEN